MARKIYTKTGDKGETSLGDGSRVSKDSLRIEAVGCVDELNSFLGLALVYVNKNKELEKIAVGIERIQNEVFKINSILALASSLEEVTMDAVKKLEQEIDAMNALLPPVDKFILPGGDEISAFLHVVRAVCRRAERNLIRLTKIDKLAEFVIPYFNRLSDWLFVATRFTEGVKNGYIS